MLRASVGLYSFRVGFESFGEVSASGVYCVICTPGGCRVEKSKLKTVSYRMGIRGCIGIACLEQELIRGSYILE